MGRLVPDSRITPELSTGMWIDADRPGANAADPDPRWGLANALRLLQLLGQSLDSAAAEGDDVTKQNALLSGGGVVCSHGTPAVAHEGLGRCRSSALSRPQPLSNPHR